VSQGATKTAVVLFNLGGPDNLAAVRPFLFNLFNDRAIIGVPQPLRWCLARLISGRRAAFARAIYREIGGASPLLEQTEAQARALEAALGDDARVFIAMRYWHPFAEATARAVKAFAPDEIVLLPLYPQFSTTTTGSSLDEWRRAAAYVRLGVPTRVVGCYPTAPGLIAAQARLIDRAISKAITETGAVPRLLLSAHGLPKKIVARGDPYQWQVERTAAAIVEALAAPPYGRTDLDWTVCYQSRVGPLEWIGPPTDGEIRRAGGEGRALVVAPIAFVSEHSETLVELDIEYRKIAEETGVPTYARVPALGTVTEFIEQLAELVRAARAGPASHTGARLCPTAFDKCRCVENAP
jgi:ferrochelatase